MFQAASSGVVQETCDVTMTKICARRCVRGGEHIKPFVGGSYWSFPFPEHRKLGQEPTNRLDVFWQFQCQFQFRFA